MSFKINDLVEKVEPFSFPFDGMVLEGKYFKYKTTTPNYAKESLASIPDELTEGTEEEKAANRKARNEAMMTRGLKIITDTIIEWNAEDGEGNPVRPSIELFSQLPDLFTEKFMNFFQDLREPKEEKKAETLPSS